MKTDPLVIPDRGGRTRPDLEAGIKAIGDERCRLAADDVAAADGGASLARKVECDPLATHRDLHWFAVALDAPHPQLIARRDDHDALAGADFAADRSAGDDQAMTGG